MKLVYYFIEMGGELFNHITGAYRHPPTFSEQEMTELYQTLYDFIGGMYDGGMLSKYHVKRGVKILELQSAWCILRQYLSNEEIKELSDAERQSKFVEIMKSSDRHRCLKAARDKVLDEARKLGLIKPEKDNINAS